MDRSRVCSLASCLLTALVACGKVNHPGDGENEPPVAMAAELSTYMSTPIVGQLEAEDADGDSLEFALVDDPTAGTLELDADGSFRYSPERGEFGEDTFSFAVDDGNGGSDEAAVAITIATLTDGTPDISFGTGGVRITDFGGVDKLSGVAIQADGRVVAAGASGPGWSLVAGYSAEGDLLSPWGEGGSGSTMLNLGTEENGDSFGDVVRQSSGRLVSVGSTKDLDMDRAVVLLGLDGDGLLDNGFAESGVRLSDLRPGAHDSVSSVALLPDDRLLVAGYVSGIDNDFMVARYSADGVLDDTFGEDGFAVVDFGGVDVAFDVAIDGDGNIVLVGVADEDIGVARLLPEGDPDTGFGDDGVVRIDLSGEPDEGIGAVFGPDGAIYVGVNTQVGAVWKSGLVRLTPTGELDTAFGEDGWALTGSATADFNVYDMLLLPNQTVLLVGGWGAGADTEAAAVRFDLSGALDPEFGTDGIYRDAIGTGGQDQLFAVALQPDGKVVAAGWSRAANLDGLVVRFGW